jgi:tRNA (cmo5U34)-methyltransferase
VTDVHDWLSPAYVDQWVKDWAQIERAGQLRRVAAAIPVDRQQAIRVLDVGGGWGPLSQEVLEHRPNAHVTLIDYSPRMLEHARVTLAPYGHRVRIEARDLTDLDWPDQLDGPYDAVVSSLAIHNLIEPALITAVYRNIHGLLRPGGSFFNLEIVRPATPALAHIAQRFSAQSAGTDPDAIAPVDPALDDGGSERVRSVANQLAWLGTAGFAQVDCLWLRASLALLAALA